MDLNKNKSKDKTDVKAVLSVKAFCTELKKFFFKWLIAAVAVAVAVFGFNFTNNIINSHVSAMINFSFDGIEAGMDPSGNKFDVNEIKSKDTIEECIEELGITDADTEDIYSNISISGIVPSNVIDRITEYSPVYDTEEVVSSKNIQDNTYYPTQYLITVNCRKAGLSNKESASLLNMITEKYNEKFFSSYGYNKSLENAVSAIDYNDYDYIDAITVFDSSLESLQEYIDELAAQDNIRFRSEESGFTFADLSQSIETIRSEDLEMISSYIVLNNVTKDKENLIANYEFKIEELSRTKTIYEERLQSINDTISNYEKNSILIFGNATDGTNATLSQSSDTYDNMIEERVLAQTNLSTTEQKINLYEERMESLEKGSTKSGSADKVEENFSKLNDKINKLMETVNVTATEYYEDVLFSNAYTVLSPASSSFFSIVKSAVTGSVNLIAAFELILLAVYIAVSLISVYASDKCSDIVKKIKGSKKKKSKKGGKNG